MTHPALTSDSVAVVTGGASGIGLAAAQEFARLGMRVAIVDLAADKLDDAEQALRGAGAAEVMTAQLDVSDRAAWEALEAEVTQRFGGTDILMNNAG
ncbi:MAG: SDR family NAD(P)-dependent oxidoreductase, partial [Pseudomonadota bacterium]